MSVFALMVGLLTADVQKDAGKPKATPPTGLWMGTLNIMLIQKLRLVVDVAQPTPDKLAAKLDSIDQGAFGIEIDEFVADGRNMKFSIKALGANYEGELKADGKYHGTFKQSGISTPLVLQRIKERPARPARAQDPKKPYPYLEDEVNVVNDKAQPPVALAGTLTLPRSAGPHPAVVLITGSGGQDRNEEIVNHRPFLVLADHLTRKGVAVLRMDDRGVGGSTGGSKEDTTKDFAGDILAAVNHLRKDKRIDAKKIGLVGHSEGGVVAPMVAVEAPDAVAFVVMLAGTTISGEQILYLQGEKILRANGASESDAKANSAVQRRLFAILREERDPKRLESRLDDEMKANVKKLPGVLRTPLETEAGRKMQAAAYNNGWMKYFLSYDPLPMLQRIRCPVLAVWGEKDLQVPPTENIDALKKGIPNWEKRNFTLQVFPNLNHLFQSSATGSPLEYAALPETFSPAALNAVSNWIRQQTSSTGTDAKKAERGP